MHRLQILHELARRGSVNGVAAALHLTPSAVSQQLSVLQKEVGRTLVTPVGRRVQLTDSGRLLARHAERILEEERGAWIALEKEQEAVSGDLSVGVLSTIAASLVPQTLDLLAARYPNISVSTYELPPEKAVSAVKHNEIDMAFILDYPDMPASFPANLNAEVIAQEQHRLVVNSQSDTFGEGPISLRSAADLPWVASGTHTEFGAALINTCRRAGFEPHIVHYVDEQATAMAIVENNLGVTLVAELALRGFHPKSVRHYSLIDPFVRRVLLLRREAHRPSEAAFAHVAKDAAQQWGLVSSRPDSSGAPGH